MQIGYHGGKCCGIKTIFGMNYDPDLNVGRLAAITYDGTLHGIDAAGRTVSSEMNMYWGPELPNQTGEERLKAYLAFLRQKRPSGLVEIALAETIYPSTSQARWFPVLQALGFRCVARWKNSNSTNWCSVWHLVMFNGVDQDSLGVTTENLIIDQGEPEVEPGPDDETGEDRCCNDSCGAPGCCCDCEE